MPQHRGNLFKELRDTHHGLFIWKYSLNISNPVSISHFPVAVVDFVVVKLKLGVVIATSRVDTLQSLSVAPYFSSTLASRA